MLNQKQVEERYVNFFALLKQNHLLGGEQSLE